MYPLARDDVPARSARSAVACAPSAASYRHRGSSVRDGLVQQMELGPGSAIWRTCLTCMKRPKPKNLSDVVDKVDKTGHDLVNQVMGKVEKEWDGKPDGYRGLIHAIHADDPEHMKMVLGLRSSCP